MKLISIVGARPQFIKAASVSRAIQKYNSHQKPHTRMSEIMAHTGQHYDENMSQVFFDELEIPQPAYNLGVGSGSHGKMTGAMLQKIEEVILKEDPDIVLVYGDTNSTLAGALAAAKLHIPVAHVEAGLRSFNRRMPEETNRVLADHVSALLFCPTDAAVKNLEKEGITKGVFNVGDVMFDSFLHNQQLAEKRSVILSKLGLKPKRFCLATVHREENTETPERLGGIFEAFSRLASPECPFVVPLHLRTEKVLGGLEGGGFANPCMKLVKAVSYLDMVSLEIHARAILMDSGGVQKEAYFAGVPCITLRDETEWVELVENGFNATAGSDPVNICRIYKRMTGKAFPNDLKLYGQGDAGRNIVYTLQSTKN